MKIILDVKPEELDHALSAAKSHLKNAPNQMIHSVDFYVASGKILHYHSRLLPDTLTVWRSEVVDGSIRS